VLPGGYVFVFVPDFVPDIDMKVFGGECRVLNLPIVPSNRVHL